MPPSRPSPGWSWHQPVGVVTAPTWGGSLEILHWKLAVNRWIRPVEALLVAEIVEFHAGTDFASLWGGGTVPAWRGRGVFRSLVAHRAALATARGFRYLQVDASSASRPIFQRLGFVELATTTPFTHPGSAG